MRKVIKFRSDNSNWQLFLKKNREHKKQKSFDTILQKMQTKHKTEVQDRQAFTSVLNKARQLDLAAKRNNLKAMYSNKKVETNQLKEIEDIYLNSIRAKLALLDKI